MRPATMTLLFLASGLLAAPQGGPPPGPPRMAYDTARERTLVGTVSAVQTRDKGLMAMVTLELKSEEATWKVLVAPEGLLKRQGISFTPGESLSILGAPMRGPEGDVFMAREITQGGKVLVFLDAQGRPSGGPH